MRTLLSFALCCGLTSIAYAAEFGTAEEAQALAKKAAAHIQSVGPEKAYADFTAKKPDFVDRDLYVIVLSPKGVVLAHGSNDKIVGKDMLDVKDLDGKAFNREMVEKAKTPNSSFTVEFKFLDPITKKVLPKTLFCQSLNETSVCSGVYKR
ncbi:MAG: cache domain-containing protein [Candidatus Competibacteraceae bacterium]